MAERRGPRRYLCSELVTARWGGPTLSEREAVINLEEIWESGCMLLSSERIPAFTPLRLSCRKSEFLGAVQRCEEDADLSGFTIEIQFRPGSEWFPEKFLPAHLLDPESLVPDAGDQSRDPQTLVDLTNLLRRVR